MKYLLLAIALTGCATQGDWAWHKPGASEQDFNQDAGQCRAQAYSLMGAPPLQRAQVYDGCIQGKGWVKQ